MKHLVGSLAAVLLGAAASADSAPEEISVLGSWSFVAQTYDNCEFSGIAHLRPGDSDTLHACELTARQACPDVTYVVRQSCQAQRSSGQLIISSRIEEFLEGPPSKGYWPDNFILTIKTENRMIGALLSHGSHAAEFRRMAEGTS